MPRPRAAIVGQFGQADGAELWVAHAEIAEAPGDGFAGGIDIGEEPCARADFHLVPDCLSRNLFPSQGRISAYIWSCLQTL